MNGTVFSVVTYSSETARRFRGTYRLHLQGRNRFQAWTGLYQTGFTTLFSQLSACLCWFNLRPCMWRRHVPPKRPIFLKLTALQAGRLRS
jgi:hypothetical protein